AQEVDMTCQYIAVVSLWRIIETCRQAAVLSRRCISHAGPEFAQVVCQTQRTRCGDGSVSCRSACARDAPACRAQGTSSCAGADVGCDQSRGLINGLRVASHGDVFRCRLFACNAVCTKTCESRVFIHG